MHWVVQRTPFDWNGMVPCDPSTVPNGSALVSVDCSGRGNRGSAEVVVGEA
jgi:hypothetical protein